MPWQRYDPHSPYSVVKTLLSRLLECNFFGRPKSPKLNRAHDFDLEGFAELELIQTGEVSCGKVFRCHDCSNGEIVAIKQIEIFDLHGEGVPSFIIREVSLLKELRHENVISLLDVKIRQKKVNLIFEQVDFDLHKYISKRCISKDFKIIKRFMHQILSAVTYCHSHKILHRDLNPKNLLIDNSRMIIKLFDFGFAREFGDPDILHTKRIRNRWYRAPEILLDFGQYSTSIDLWSVGCIFSAMVIGMPIFQASYCTDELEAIFRVLGTPTEETWEGVTKLSAKSNNRFHLYTKFPPVDLDAVFADLEPEGLDLLKSLLCLDPNKRISAEAALKHAYFNDLQRETKGDNY